mmetsp:Transcript_987/g.1870  ORF Transcript_987/g.1870 Transcript_987/m.1870 type:complete len:242 (-) Transcript_987:1170-1895(-)|eukprot:CAMPEP_0182446192 /NCGR_PEP_ID=MMETSP1172-20130603/4042_1 /TAXON_ID=708627 /ORGANISM="Timspurckia oligopyrenoides, Strain CCMP3278" /LENGTH=241 /DNA_ID=CAMNT_0024642085 /DNA_START=57 /DNA_END=782 /DNA_ORIENTATION=+
MSRIVNESFLRRHIVQDRKTWLIDCKSQVLGAVAKQIVLLLQGKHKPYYTKDVNCADRVVVINAKHIEVLGRKRETKVYRSHSGYPGGMHEVSFLDMLKKHPTKIIKLAVSKFLPKNKTRKVRLRKFLKVYPEDKHPHEENSLIRAFSCSIGERIGYGEPPYEEEFEMLWDNLVPFIHPEGLDVGVLDVSLKRDPVTDHKAVGLQQLLLPKMDSEQAKLNANSYISSFDSVSKHSVSGVPL